MGDRLLRIGLGLADMWMLCALAVLTCLGVQRVGCSHYFFPIDPPNLCTLGMDQPGDMLAILCASPFFAAALVHGLFIICSPGSKDFRTVATQCVRLWMFSLALGTAMLIVGSSLNHTS